MMIDKDRIAKKVTNLRPCLDRLFSDFADDFDKTLDAGIDLFARVHPADGKPERGAGNRPFGSHLEEDSRGLQRAGRAR